MLHIISWIVLRNVTTIKVKLTHRLTMNGVIKRECLLNRTFRCHFACYQKQSSNQLGFPTSKSEQNGRHFRRRHFPMHLINVSVSIKRVPEAMLTEPVTPHAVVIPHESNWIKYRYSIAENTNQINARDGGMPCKHFPYYRLLMTGIHPLSVMRYVRNCLLKQ